MTFMRPCEAQRKELTSVLRERAGKPRRQLKVRFMKAANTPTRILLRKSCRGSLSQSAEMEMLMECLMITALLLKALTRTSGTSRVSLREGRER